MAYLVLARKYRPQNFEEVIGQEQITRTLSNAIAKNKIASAYLFAGPRGVGKTSMARILAKALDCEKGPTATPCNQCKICKEITAGNNPDVLEIDGASNRGIDQIRELRENAKFTPTKSRFKIYIIDEVHMLTTEAFNALLKTLEEPPAHVKFIFATTQPDKVISTIISRCQHFDFKPIKVSDILTHLKNIAGKEKIKAEEDALRKIAVFADGSLRDSLSILDQIVSFTEENTITIRQVNDLLGLVNEETYFKVVETIINNDPASLFVITDRLTSEGKNLSSFFGGLLKYFRNILLLKVSYALSSLINEDNELKQVLKDQGKNFSSEELFRIIEKISLFKERIRREESASVVSEVFLLSLINDFSKKTPQKKEDKTIEDRSAAEEKKEKIILKEEVKEPETSYPINDEEINKSWPSVLEEIKGKKTGLKVCLQQGKIKDVKENSITIEFEKGMSFQKETVERNRKFLADLLKKRFARNFIIKTVYGDKKENTDSPEMAPRRKPTMEEEKKVEEILELFGGKIVSRKEE